MELGLVAHTFDLRTQGAEAAGSLLVQGQAGPQREFQASQSHTARICPKEKEKRNMCDSLRK